jgi:hypothetical protein
MDACAHARTHTDKAISSEVTRLYGEWECMCVCLILAKRPRSNACVFIKSPRLIIQMPSNISKSWCTHYTGILYRKKHKPLPTWMNLTKKNAKQKLYTKEYILYYSINIKSKMRQNQAVAFFFFLRDAHLVKLQGKVGKWFDKSQSWGFLWVLTGAELEGTRGPLTVLLTWVVVTHVKNLLNC